MKKTDNVNHPAHYKPLFLMRPLECIDITEHLDFCRGCAFKYVWRAGQKGNMKKMIEDLQKAAWYMERFFNNSYDRGGGPWNARMLFEQIEKPESGDLRRKYDILQNIVSFSALAQGQIEAWIRDLKKKGGKK